MLKRLYIFGVCLIVIGLLVTGCGGSAAPAPVEQPTAVAQQPTPLSSDQPTVAPANQSATSPLPLPTAATDQTTPPAGGSTGNMLADLGLRPETNGFGFENYGGDKPYKNLTPEDMQRLFGDQVCGSKADGKCVLAPQIQQAMEQWNQSMSGGHCYGMSTAALRFYKQNLNVADYGANSVADLQIDNNEKLQREIALNFVFQYLNPVQNGVIKGTPTEVLDKLVEVLKPGAAASEVYTIGFFKADGTGGHAVTPFAVEDRGNGQVAVKIYDNNWPKATREIMFDRNANTWTYFAAINPGVPGAEYKGDANTKSLGLYPTTPGLSVKQGSLVPCVYCLAARTTRPVGLAAPIIERNEIFLDGNTQTHAHLLITDEQGRRYGFLSDGTFVTEIPGVEIDRVMSDNWLDAEEPIYHVPTNIKFTLTIDGSALKQADETSVVMIGPGYDIGVEGIKMDPGQKDTLTLAPDGSHLVYQTDGAESPDIVMGIEHEGADYDFLIKGVDLQGGAVDVSLDYAKGTLKLDTQHNKQTATYALVMDKIDDAGEVTFSHDSIELAPGDIAYLEFGKWAGNGQPLSVGIDRGGTGTVSETLELTDAQ